MQQGAGGHEAEVGGGGGKATRRKGRDMERALARGDLGALGNEVRARFLSKPPSLSFRCHRCVPTRIKPASRVCEMGVRHRYSACSSAHWALGVW